MRTFEKDGRRTTTGSPAAAVELLATGWVEIKDRPKPDLTRTQPKPPAPDTPAGKTD